MTQSSAYRDAGVDIDAQEQALGRIGEIVRSTFTPGVLGGIGSFGGLFRPDLGGLEDPVLVSSADGVGTKLAVARRAGDFSTVGHDLVNHCVNDILVQGAEPLFFLDYVGAGVLDPGAFTELVQGVAAGCRENGCALLGGETAEMPGFYQAGDYELVGFVVGLVDRPRLLGAERVRAGDVLLGLPSSGLHTNGYTLVRRIVFDVLGLELGDRLPGSSRATTVGEHLLSVHRSYLPVLRPLLREADPRDHGLHAMAHITGGGLVDNLPRVLPEGCVARVRLGAWEVPEIFRVLARHGEVSAQEMLRVFNLGVGMVAFVAPDAVESFRRQVPEAFELGTVEDRENEDGDGNVIFDGELEL